ncbi:DUF4294 domain-containing protein [Mucilaginibacter polytrichastri]|uniref:DUF4294 domain-containing protein n=1 Tax=Mucilaginibacter polytrichastri TaxID=1302689 RepID=A0A1Q5ZU51_9SPHI|nr:DUF4294 domain-containing protein [Mucilaginibacter polytrichastri]OKS85290.1 hypothetical protein RG47T_0734 [Mucilaginibacter polytrichastri]SFS41281.1 protein of unknown function [Mucilaginibacter polytrichastri]
MKFFTFLVLLSGFAGIANAQTDLTHPKVGKNDTIKTYMTVLDGELVPWVVTPEVKIVDTRIFTSEADRQAYYRLRYNVMKVLPYAKFASQRYAQLQRDLATTADKGRQKEMINACETQIKDLFNHEIKNLTITQGEVLIKLVSRETGSTSFAMAKDLKGGFHAFMFQSVARIFGHNLKQQYDAANERDIETILHQAGYTSSLY